MFALNVDKLFIRLEAVLMRSTREFQSHKYSIDKIIWINFPCDRLTTFPMNSVCDQTIPWNLLETSNLFDQNGDEIRLWFYIYWWDEVLNCDTFKFPKHVQYFPCTLMFRSEKPSTCLSKNTFLNALPTVFKRAISMNLKY